MLAVARVQLLATALVILWTKLSMIRTARRQLFDSMTLSSEPIMAWAIYLVDVMHQDLTVCGMLLIGAWWLFRIDAAGVDPRPRPSLVWLPAMAIAVVVSAYHMLAFIYWFHYSSFPSSSILGMWNHLPIALEEAAADPGLARWGPILATMSVVHLVGILFHRYLDGGMRRFFRTETCQVIAAILVGFLIVCWSSSTPRIYAQNQNPLFSLAMVSSLEDLVENCPERFEARPPPAGSCPDPIAASTGPSTMTPAAPARRRHLRIIVYYWESMPYGAVFDRSGACRIPELSPLREQMVAFDRLYTVQPMSFPSLVSFLTGTYSPGKMKYSTMSAWVEKKAPGSPFRSLREKGWKLRPATSSITDYGGYEGLFRTLGFETMVTPGNDRSPPYREHKWGVDDRFLFDTARTWIEADPEASQFLLLIGSSTHHPYYYEGEKSSEGSEKEKHFGLARETAGLAAEFYGWLKEKQLAQDSLFLVVGDHGEAFGEHEGNWIHGSRLYEENTRVAGFLLHPDRDGLPSSIPDVFSMTELGRALLDPSFGDPVHRSTHYPGHALSLHPLMPGRLSLVTAGKKLVVDLGLQQRELYDLVVDPDEKADMSAEKPDIADCYQKLLATQFRAVARDWR